MNACCCISFSRLLPCSSTLHLLMRRVYQLIIIVIQVSLLKLHCLIGVHHSLSESFSSRCYCVSEVLDEKIYAIGGIGPNSNNLPSWETYNTEIRSWTLHENPNIFPDIEDSIVLGGKIYIRGGSSPQSSSVSAFVYEPSSSTWQPAASELVSGWYGPAVVVDGTLYVLDQSSGTRLMMWQKDIREWVAVGRLSPLLTKPPCRLVAVGNNIFIIGKGLSTVVFNVENARNMNGVLVSTSIPKSISDDDVISCKAITI